MYMKAKIIKGPLFEERKEQAQRLLYKYISEKVQQEKWSVSHEDKKGTKDKKDK